MKTLPIEYIRRRLAYNPMTGEFRWIETTSRKLKPGAKAGSTGTRHIKIYVDKSMYMAHRLAWAHHYGAWPDRDLDHIDGNSFNNAIANLRECTMSQNQANKKRRVDNTSGYKGVYRSNYRKHQNKPWTAEIRISGKKRHIGRFKTPAEAHVAYVAAAKKLFGEFARAG